MFNNAPYPLFHGEFTSADASALSEANSRITLYDVTKTAITLAAGAYCVITDVTIVCGAALTTTVYDGGNNTVAAGERIAQGNYAANGGESKSFLAPHYCAVGTYPKVKTSGAGQVDVIIHGFIVGQS